VGHVDASQRPAKDPALRAVLSRLRADLGDGYFVEVPHWDADLVAIGLGRPDDPRVLVYVAVALDGSGLYVECEEPATHDPDGTEYRVTFEASGLDYGAVRDTVLTHLRPAASDGARPRA